MHTIGIYEGQVQTNEGDTLITFCIKNQSVIDKLNKLAGQMVSIDVVKDTDKRSLNANKYLWGVIIKNVAIALNLDDMEAYKYLLHKHGIFEVVRCEYRSVPVIQKQYRYAEVFYDGYYFEPDPTDMVNVHVYMGTSKYDKQEMARFIDLCQEEMKEMGLAHVLFTDDEVKRLISQWNPQ